MFNNSRFERPEMLFSLLPIGKLSDNVLTQRTEMLDVYSMSVSNSVML